MKINGYEIALSEAQLDDIINNRMRRVKLVSKDFAGYKNLTEGNKKALEHLVAAAKIFDDVAMEQDHEMNLPMKKPWKKLPKTVLMPPRRSNFSPLSTVWKDTTVLTWNRSKFSKASKEPKDAIFIRRI